MANYISHGLIKMALLARASIVYNSLTQRSVNFLSAQYVYFDITGLHRVRALRIF